MFETVYRRTDAIQKLVETVPPPEVLTSLTNNVKTERNHGDPFQALTRTTLPFHRSLDPGCTPFRSTLPEAAGSGAHYQGNGFAFTHHDAHDLGKDVFPSGYETQEPFFQAAPIAGPSYTRMQQRTIFAHGLASGTTHADIASFIRGGQVLDIYLRSKDQSANISFVEGEAAQNFMNYVRRNDIYCRGKRVCKLHTCDNSADCVDKDWVSLE